MPLQCLTVMKAVASEMDNRIRVVWWFPSGIRLRKPVCPVAPNQPSVRCTLTLRTRAKADYATNSANDAWQCCHCR